MPTAPRYRPALTVALAAALAAASALALAILPAPRMAAAAEPAPAGAPASLRETDGGEAEASELDFAHRREAEFFRHLAGGEIDAERVRRMWADSRTLRSEAPATSDAVNSWQLAGPVFSVNPNGGFMTGRVRDIDPINVRALAASGGLWRFNIFGGIPMSDPVPASWFGSFATNPNDANTILLGTGEYRIASGSGMFKTTDGGATWTPSPMSPQPSAFSRVRWSPDGATAYASSDAGFYRSIDGGASWTRTLSGQVSDFSITVGLPSTIFATLVSLGVWRSDDGGVTWAQLTTGGVPSGIAGVGAVSAVNFPGAGFVYIYVAFDTRIWRSTNSAFSWTEITPTNFGIGNSGYGPVLSANPTDPQTVLYGNVPFCRSDNAGTNWTKLATPHLHADYHMFAWDADGVGVWAANDGGWSHSLDRGLTWNSSSNAMPISQFYSIDCEKTELGYMIGGTQDNNILYTPNPSLNWIDPALGSTEGDATGAVIDLYEPSHMWAVSGVSGGSIAYPRYRTLDGGTTWNEVTSGIGPTPSGGQIRTDNAFPVRLVTSAGPDVYESLDGGGMWTKSNPSAFPANITNLTSSTRVLNGAVLYATLGSSTAGQRLMVRDNGTWVERSAGLPAGSVIKVVPHPWAGSADEAWAVMAAGSNQKLFHTTNRGVTWTNVTGDFPSSIPISDVVPNPRHDGELYVGSLLGAFRSKNGGVNWEHWNNGMPQGAMISEMTYIDLTSTTGQFFVVAATYGRSVWKRDVSGEDVFPTLEVSNPFVQEGDTGQNTAWFRVHVPTPQTTNVTVDYSTQDGTATLAGGDYVATSGTLTFAPYQTDQWVGVPVNGDVQIETDETFQLVLSNPLRAQVGSPGTCTLQDDDAHGLVCGGLYVTNGTVSAIAPSGSTIYIGGTFTSVGPATGCAATLDGATGQPVSLPKVDGSVNALASDGAGGWYLGGLFKHVGGVARTNLAHVLADGSVAPWNPAANDMVFALVVSGGTVYAGGRFSSIAGVPCHYLAAINNLTGLPAAWAPEPNDQVLALALSGSTLYVGGSFTSIGGKSRSYIAALSASAGTATPWNPAANAPVSAILFDGGPLFVAGSFTSIGGQSRNSIAALDLGSGAATAWDPAPDNLVFTLAADAGTVYAGGVFANIGGQPRANLAALDRTSGAATGWMPNPDGAVLALARSGGTIYVGGTYGNIGGQARNNLAAVSLASGLASAWNPDPNNTVAVLGLSGANVFAAGYFTSLAAQPRARLAAFDATSGHLLPWDPGADASVLSLVAGGGLVYAGGQFANIGGQPRNRLAALDAVSGEATAWDPNASSTVRTMLLSGTKLYVGGNFTTIGGQTRNRGAAFATSDGSLQSWNPNANSTIFSLATDGTFIYAGGAFTSIGGQARNGLALLSSTSGAASPTWNPSPNAPVNLLVVNGSALFVCGSYTQIAGVNRPRLSAIDLSNATLAPWAPAPNDMVYSLVPSGSQIYVAGAFTAIGGQWRNHLALLRPSTNQVSSWAPEPDGDVSVLAQSGSTIYAGGSFTSIGGMPQAHFGCLIPIGSVDVPPPASPDALTLRLSPNPSPGRVRVEYDLPEAARVSIAVYDVQGRKVGPSFEARQEAGAHAETWDGSAGRGISPGVYFLRFAAGERALVRRLVIL